VLLPSASSSWSRRSSSGAGGPCCFRCSRC